jgi:hypothetical protein
VNLATVRLSARWPCDAQACPPSAGTRIWLTSPARPFTKGEHNRGSAPNWRSARTGRSGRMRKSRPRAVAADRAYGDQDGLRGELAESGPPSAPSLAASAAHGTRLVL